MAVIASWLSKRWEVSPQKVVNLSGLTTSFKCKSETNDGADGTSSTNVTGLELQQISFEMSLSDALGVNVRSEIDSWGKLTGQIAPFYLGGKRFGPQQLRLDSVDVPETNVDDLGRIRGAKLSLVFIEVGETTASSNQVAAATSASSYSELGVTSAPQVTASQITALPSDKYAKKPVRLTK